MLVFLNLLALAASQSCPSFKCKTSSIKFPDDSYCIHTISQTHYVKPCKTEDYKCIPANPLDETKCSYVSPYTAGSKLPGESCHYSSDCYTYGTCTNEVCVGLSLGSPCSADQMCDVGSFCNSQGLCEKQLQANTFGCTKDYDCENTACCQIVNYLNSTQNKCVKYYSLPNFSISKGYTDFACQSGFSNGTHCVTAPVSTKVPKVCTSSQDCVSQGGSFSGHCGCGYNPQGNMYCSLFAGDKIAVEAVKYYKKWFGSKSILNAHTRNRYDYSFIRDFWDSDNAAGLVYYDSFYRNFASYYLADECVLEVFGNTYLNAYWDLPEDSSSSFSFMLAVSGIVVIF